MGTLESEAFEVRSTYHIIKDKSPVRMFFGREIIPPIKHVVDWKYIRQIKQAQIERDIIQENLNIIEYDYRVGFEIESF